MQQFIIHETFKNKIDDIKTKFETINEKLSPKELLNRSQEFGFSGDKLEIDKIKKEIEEASRFLPQNDGEWTGKPGDSVWKPDPEYVPKKHNPEGKTWREILQKYNIDGIRFKNGEPDFSTVSEGTVKIENFTTDRNANYTQADEQLAKKWTEEKKDGKEWTAQDVKNYRKENNLTWHERSDMKTLDLVPQEVHGNIPHHGGISQAKQQQ